MQIDEIESHPGILTYLVFCLLAIVINIVILFMILIRTASIQTPYLLLIFYFHISIVGDLVTSLPYVFTPFHDWCITNEAFKYYFNLMNLLIVAFLIQGNRTTLMNGDRGVSLWKRFVAYFMIFVFPCISFLPMIDGFYRHGDGGNPWCTVAFDRTGFWPFVVQYLWVFIVLAINSFTNVYLFRFLVLRDSSALMRQRFIRMIGSYAMLVLVSWIPRFISIWGFEPANDDDGEENRVITFALIEHFPMVVASLCYAGLFFLNRKIYLSLDRARSQATSTDTITFSTKELLDIIDFEDEKTLYQHVMSFVFRGSSSFRGANRDSQQSEPARVSQDSQSSNTTREDESRDTISDYFKEVNSKKKRVRSANKNGIAMKDIFMYDNPLSGKKEDNKDKKSSKSPSASPQTATKKTLDAAKQKSKSPSSSPNVTRKSFKTLEDLKKQRKDKEKDKKENKNDKKHKNNKNEKNEKKRDEDDDEEDDWDNDIV